MHQHRSGGRETTIPAIAIDYGGLNECDDLLQEAAGVRLIFGSEGFSSDSDEICRFECQH